MKQFWVDIRPWNKEIATTAIESGADALVVDRAEDVRRLGRITTVAPDGDLKPGKDVIECTITDKASENKAAAQGKHMLVIVATSDWTVIPLENLVAQSDKIIALVRDEKDAQMALHVLEKGTHGILLKTESPAMVKSVAALTKSPTSSAMLLVHAETLENPYVAPRPFRVNAGAVHAYILLPDGKTAYLSDLAIGGQVLVTDGKGTAHTAIIGRTKIERRPLLLVEAEAGKAEVSLILQNAETIRLVGEDGKAISVVNLQKGDTIMGCVLEGGRHFGMAVKETIREK
jgi:3-dehydroquinate synthase II